MTETSREIGKDWRTDNTITVQQICEKYISLPNIYTSILAVYDFIKSKTFKCGARALAHASNDTLYDSNRFILFNKVIAWASGQFRETEKASGDKSSHRLYQLYYTVWSVLHRCAHGLHTKHISNAKRNVFEMEGIKLSICLFLKKKQKNVYFFYFHEYFRCTQMQTEWLVLGCDFHKVLYYYLQRSHRGIREPRLMTAHMHTKTWIWIESKKKKTVTTKVREEFNNDPGKCRKSANKTFCWLPLHINRSHK